MDVNDVFGLGKILPVDKLFEVVSQSVGKLSKSYFERKDIDTKAYEIKKLAEARAEEMNIISTAVKKNFLTGSMEYKDDKININTQVVDLALEDRANNRQSYQEQKKQLNVESITSIAANELKNEEPIVNDHFDEDWFNRFFKISEDISNEDMQLLWGKILAGQIKRPKSFSLRTLELIKNISSHEAKVFNNIANLAIQSRNSYFIFEDSDDSLEKKYGIGFSEIQLMREIGLIHTNDSVSHNIFRNDNDSQTSYISGNILIVVDVKANTPNIEIPVLIFTNAGHEILNLNSKIPNMEYLSEFAKLITKQSGEVKYAQILSISNDNVSHKPFLKFNTD